MSNFLAPQIVLLKSGTDTSQGKGQLGMWIYSISSVYASDVLT